MMMAEQFIDDDEGYVGEGGVYAINPARLINMDQHPEVVGWCAAEMPAKWFLAMRVKWAHDFDSSKPLLYELWMVTVDMAVRYGWKSPLGREYFRNMSLLAIRELYNPTQFRHPDSYVLRMTAIGCSRSQWFERWAGRYEKVYRVVDDWSSRGWKWMKCHPDMIASKKRKAVKKLMARPAASMMNVPRPAPVIKMVKEPNWAAMNRDMVRLK